jgi:hypothetical protein
MRRLCGIVVGLTLVTAFPTEARAESADDLFVKGQELLAAGRVVEACRKFEESSKVEPAIGVRFHLAQCHERIGRTASAWKGFLDVAKDAHARGQKAREKLARERAAALEPRLTRLVLDIKNDQTKELTIHRNGVVVPRSEWGVSIPFDPGVVVIEGSAPGKKSWRVSMDINESKRDWIAVVPDIEIIEPGDERAVSTTTSTSAAAPGGSEGLSTKRTIALGVAGAGGVAIGVGVVFGLMALRQNASSGPHCTANVCDADGVSLRDSAVSSGHISTIGFVSGIGLVGAGLGYFFFAPRTPSPSTNSAQLDVVPGLGRLDVRASW